VRLDEKEPHFVIVDLLIVGYFARRIDRFLITTPDHANSLGFIVRISLRANLDDRVVVDEVPIDGHVEPLIEYVIAGC
jgi:hypothetical protein